MISFFNQKYEIMLIADQHGVRDEGGVGAHEGGTRSGTVGGMVVKIQ